VISISSPSLRIISILSRSDHVEVIEAVESFDSSETLAAAPQSPIVVKVIEAVESFDSSETPTWLPTHRKSEETGVGVGVGVGSVGMGVWVAWA
jgi:hypothetical protein